MNNNNIEEIKNTTGKSFMLEQSLSIFNDMLKDNVCDTGGILSLIVNNNLPNELRSIAWRIFLGILPICNSTFEWYQITQNTRDNFEKMTDDKEIQKIKTVIKKESDVEEIESNFIKNEYHRIIQEMEKIKNNYDFFRSDIVEETLLRLYLIWKIKNNTQNQISNFHPFYILAGIIYSLYPSILLFNPEHKEIKSQEELDNKFLLYFLNSEEFFDADVYSIFDAIMNKNNFKILVNTYDKLNRQEWDTIKNSIVENENFWPLSEDNKILLSNVNRFEKISYFYLKLTNENLLEHLFSIKLDPYNIIEIWYVSLLTSSICFGHISYLWDNIFAFSQMSGDAFDFLDFVLISIFNNLSDILISGDILNDKMTLMRYPEHKMDLKEIVNKAFKYREKLIEYEKIL